MPPEIGQTVVEIPGLPPSQCPSSVPAATGAATTALTGCERAVQLATLRE